MLQNQGKQWVRRRCLAGKQAVFMDVISLMVRVSELTSSSYSAPSCRGPPVTRPVEMRLYHHHTSHWIRCVRGHFKKKKVVLAHLCISLSPSFFSLNFISSLTHTHTVHRWTQTATCLKATQANLDSSGRGAGEDTQLASHPFPQIPSYQQVLSESYTASLSLNSWGGIRSGETLEEARGAPARAAGAPGARNVNWQDCFNKALVFADAGRGLVRGATQAGGQLTVRYCQQT